MSTRHLTTLFFEKYPESSSAMGCVEPGYDDKPVILANWNNIPQKYFDSLEKHGFSCEWEDEWIVCDNCYKAFRSSPDSYGWEMFGYIGDGFCVCGNCIEWDEYLSERENSPRQAVTCALFDRFENEITSRYELIQDGYESGWHDGQNDNPTTILKSLLEKNPTGKYLFIITDQSQFYITFAVYQRKDSDE